MHGSKLLRRDRSQLLYALVPARWHCASSGTFCPCFGRDHLEIEFAIFLHFSIYLWWSLTLSTAFGPQPTEHTSNEYTHRRNAISHIPSSLPFFGDLSKFNIHDNTSYTIPAPNA